MNKSRLITFGCSYTYGIGLPDCINVPLIDLVRPPSKMGWPALVANYLNLDLVNMSYPGASNFEILYSILEFKFKPSDTIVIMWSHYLRDIFFTRWFKFVMFRRRLGPWKTTPLGKKWINQLSERDYAMKTWIYMHHASLHLEKLNLKYIHYPVSPKELQQYYSPVEFNNLHLDGMKILDKAIDNSHPGLASQKETADIIYRILKNEK